MVIGWTPSSHVPNAEFSTLSQFIAPFGRESVDKDNNDYPVVRSGHRCFTDNDYFYVIGGYAYAQRQSSIYKELWAMSLATFEWRRYENKGELPETLASFALVQTFPYSKSFILFGGSGTAFGSSSSNEFYLVRINNDDCSIHSQKLNIVNTIPQAVYGHAMCAGEFPGKYYIIGGTEGVIFNFDVHALTMKANPDAGNDDEKFIWHCELITKNTEHRGRYRLEATYDEKKHSLLMFGGGNNLEVFGFETMISINVGTRKTTEVDTIPDAEFGFPKPRRCHTIARHNRRVVMTGGIHHLRLLEDTELFDDVWIFDLDNYSWRKYEHSLFSPVFFHDSVMTEDGWMLSFGGAHDVTPAAGRNNILHGAWFDVPSLQRFSLEALRREYPNKFAGLYCGNLRLSEVFDVFNVFCKNRTVEQKEREIIENGQLKFHERENRTRYFLNTNYKDFIVTHERERERRRGPRRRRLHIVQEPGPDPEPADAAQGLGGVQLRVQRILDNFFMQMVNNRRDDEEVDDEESEESDEEEEEEEEEEEAAAEDEEENDNDAPERRDLDDDDFENGRFELIPQRQIGRPE